MVHQGRANPSIFMASREIKWRIPSRNWAGQPVTLLHLRTASPSSRTASAPQTGHLSGIWKTLSLPSLFSLITFTTSGITSPAFCTRTWSPIRISFLRISSSLCKVARLIVEPAICTGSRMAVGVKAPVLPTVITISLTRLVFCWPGIYRQ